MRTPFPRRARSRIGIGLTCVAMYAATDAGAQKDRVAPEPTRVTVPARPRTSIFKGSSGERWSSELTFDRAKGLVTVTLSVQDAAGYFVPNLRRENFAVYENGRRQTNVTVEVDHAPLTLAVLFEAGGRYQQLNRAIVGEVGSALRLLTGALGRHDRVAVFSYADGLTTLMDFDRPLSDLDSILSRPVPPSFSEANLYDALIAVLERMTGVSGRKAVLLVSSGLDTFSRASADDAKAAADRARTPVYVIDLSGSATRVADAGPVARLNWAHIREQLALVARVSGGRAYDRESSADPVAIYDDMMEHLRIRYVITYVPDVPPTPGEQRTVRVELIDRNGAPVRILDTAGRGVAPRILAQVGYQS